MSTLTADATLTKQLSQVNRLVEVRDTDGNLLGYYAPTAVAEQVPAIKWAAMYDPDEIRRLKALKQPGYTIEQVRDHLRPVANDQELQRKHAEGTAEKK